MSEPIRHECGLAYIRLLKPLSHYHLNHGTALYGLNKLYLLMEKQHNRGQDGAGIATVKLNVEPGYPYTNRLRFDGAQAIKKIVQAMSDEITDLEKKYPGILQHPGFLKGYMRFAGEVLLGHLRYGTQGKNNVEFCHPFIKPSMNPSRYLTMAGNFNLVNTDDLFKMLHTHPDSIARQSDLGAMIETIHHYLCLEDEKDPADLNVTNVLKNATTHFDGGYVFSGLVGNGDSFVMRDPNGIRPCYYYRDDEVVVAASERAAIMTTFNVRQEQVLELKPGHAIIVNGKGEFNNVEILAAREFKACSFERIYFSRGSDPEIYRERMELGRNLAGTVLKNLDNNLKNTIVSFIPNTAEIAFYGLIKGLEDYLKETIINKIMARRDTMTPDEMKELINRRVRIEKIAIKDAKLRTFITEDSSRNEMVQHVYDITYGTVKPGVDTIVIIDDSIVRGTTLKESIIRMLNRLEPKRIVIVSSAPQIRYPDCYGIDMSKMGDFIAFQAAVALLKDNGMDTLLDEVFKKCKEALKAGTFQEYNFVKDIYSHFTADQVSAKIAEMLKPDEVAIPVDIIYQSLEGLHSACPNNLGDWYFTGNYPTPGGNRVANRAFMNYMEQKTGRGYE